jgi:hypothetical protein
MNVNKHMEAIFLAAAALACVTGYATAGDQRAVPVAAKAAAKVAYSEANGLQTVTITARHLDDGTGV